MSVRFKTVIFELITGIKIIPSNLPKIRVALVAGIILLSHHFAFVFRGKYKRIEEEFNKESKEERKQKARWVLLYTFGSMVLFIFLIIFGAWMNS